MKLKLPGRPPAVPPQRPALPLKLKLPPQPPPKPQPQRPEVRKPIVQPTAPPGPCIQPTGRPGVTCSAKRIDGSQRCAQHAYLDALPPEQRIPVQRSWLKPAPISVSDRSFTLEVVLRPPETYGEAREISFTFVTPHADELTSPNRLAGRACMEMESILKELFTDAHRGSSKER